MRQVYIKSHDAFIRAFETPIQGPAVIYLPAISFSAAASFFNVITHPDMPRHRALAVDYMGSGSSDTPRDFGYTIDDHVACIAALLDQAGCAGATLVGHSMGGTVAIALALSRPDLVGNLIVCEGNVTSGGGALVKQIVAVTEKHFTNTVYPQMQADIRTGAIAGDASGIRRSAVWQHAAPVGLHRNAQALFGIRDGMLDAFLDLTIPRTFIYGETTYPATPDDIGPDTPSPGLLTSRGVNLGIVPGAGHNLMFENLDGFVSCLSDAAF